MFLKKKYRVTRRGKVVFTLMGIIMIYGMYLLITSTSPVIDEESSVPQETVQNEDVSKDESEADALEANTLDTEDSMSDEGSLVPEVSETNGLSEDEKIENCTTSSLEVDEETQRLKLLEASGFTVYYDSNAYYVPEGKLPMLAEFASVALKYPDEEIIIEGNVNKSIGPSEFWDTEDVDQLGYTRGLVIKNDLIKRGISKERIIIYNNRDEKPLNVDLSEESIALNRRADVFFSQFMYKEIDNK